MLLSCMQCPCVVVAESQQQHTISATLTAVEEQLLCRVNAAFFPSGSWRLARRGFNVDFGNTLASAQTHYKPRVFLDCPDTETTPGDKVAVAMVSVSEAKLQQLFSDSNGRNGNGGADSLKVGLTDGWLHWLVRTVPIDCELGKCHKAESSSKSSSSSSASALKGKAVHPDQGTTVAQYVPPGVAELESVTVEGRALYVVAVFADTYESSGLTSDTTTLDASSSSSANRVAALEGEAMLMGGDVINVELLGFNYFVASIDGMAQMQFTDVKDSSHGIVHLGAHKDDL